MDIEIFGCCQRQLAAGLKVSELSYYWVEIDHGFDAVVTICLSVSFSMVAYSNI